MQVDSNIVETYIVGKDRFIVVLCEALGIPGLIDEELSAHYGRIPDVAYGTLAMVMMVNMCHHHRSIYEVREYYEYADLEGLFHHPMTLHADSFDS